MNFQREIKLWTNYIFGKSVYFKSIPTRKRPPIYFGILRWKGWLLSWRVG